MNAYILHTAAVSSAECKWNVFILLCPPSPPKTDGEFLITPRAHSTLLASIKRKTYVVLYFYLLNGKIHSLQATRWVAFITASEGRVAPLLATCQEAPISTDGVAVTSCLVFGKCRVQIFVLMLGISNKCLWALSPSPEFLGAIAKSMPSLGHNSFFPHLSNSSFINYSIIWRQLFSVTENFMK